MAEPRSGQLQRRHRPLHGALLTVVVLLVATPAFVAAGVALQGVAGAGFFSYPVTEPDAWWYPYASAVYIAAEVASVAAAFVLSRRWLPYAMLPLMPPLLLILVFVLLAVLPD